MKVKCPHCGKTSDVTLVTGRPRLNIPLINVYESLRSHRSVVDAASELGCSQGYIFGIMKANGLKVKDVIAGKATLPDARQKVGIL